MQNKILKLKEIIYEITGHCDNHCDFCGSKEIWDEKIDEDRIKGIVDEIAKYPPEQIDISGGNPLLVSRETHQYLVEKLKEKSVVVKILTSAKDINRKDYYDIINLYNHIGLSVNEKRDIELLLNYPEKKISDIKYELFKLRNKITIITNFNLSNIFLFEKIKKIVKIMNCLWMVQYTIYKDENNSLAIYNNDSSVEFLKKSIQDADNEGIKILISDNMSGNMCTAGSNSLGILSSGKIIPCLSMRAWMENIDFSVVGNIILTPLKYIWENRFNNYRFNTFKCCKDHCRNKVIGTYCLKDTIDDIKKEIKRLNIPSISPSIPLLYGVPMQPRQPNLNEGTFAYAVPNAQGPIITFYGVTAPDKTFEIKYETTIEHKNKN